MGIKSKALCCQLIICLFLFHIVVPQNIRDTIPEKQNEDRALDIKKNKIKKGIFSFLGSNAVENKKANQGKLLVNPFFLPGYSPDIQFSLAGGAIFSFKTKQNDSLLPRSSVPVTVTYSSIHSFIASAGWTTF